MFFLDLLNTKFLRYLNYVAYNHRKRAAVCLTNDKLSANCWLSGACEVFRINTHNMHLVFFIGSFTFYLPSHFAEKFPKDFEAGDFLIWRCAIAYTSRLFCNEKTALNNPCYMVRDSARHSEQHSSRDIYTKFNYFSRRYENGQIFWMTFGLSLRGRWPHYNIYFIFDNLQRGDTLCGSPNINSERPAGTNLVVKDNAEADADTFGWLDPNRIIEADARSY